MKASVDKHYLCLQISGESVESKLMQSSKHKTITERIANLTISTRGSRVYIVVSAPRGAKIGRVHLFKGS